MNYTNELITKGYCIIDNILPVDLANEIYESYKKNHNWDHIYQKRYDKYALVNKFELESLPKSDEIYSAQFCRNNFLEKEISITDAFQNYFIPLLKNVSPFEMNDFDVRCYKLDYGDHYRTHCDGYAGKINLIYYVNKDWRWDWGGILNVLSNENEDFCESIFPKFNRVVLLNNKTFSSPHFVSSVEKWASNPRFSIVSFNK